MTPGSPDPGAASRTRVLIVDDHEEIRELVRSVLGRKAPHFEFDEAENGEQALERVASHCPAIVILDVMMPGMDGYEVCRRLRADEATARLPILILSAIDDPRNRRLALEAGADEYVVKPFQAADLFGRVRGLLERTPPAARPSE